MSVRGGWGRSRGPRHCGKRRTSPNGWPVVCRKIADGSHTKHWGREQTPWGVEPNWYVWANTPKSELQEVVL